MQNVTLNRAYEGSSLIKVLQVHSVFDTFFLFKQTFVTEKGFGNLCAIQTRPFHLYALKK